MGARIAPKASPAASVIPGTRPEEPERDEPDHDDREQDEADGEGEDRVAAGPHLEEGRLQRRREEERRAARR